MKPSEIKPLSQEMEDKILAAASRIFVIKGKAGTSMQDIALEAGINRTLLNYYFRSKDNLFDQVFQRVLDKFFPAILNNMTSDLSLDKKLENFIDYYFTMLLENPVMPLFVLQELSSNPEKLVNRLKVGGMAEIIFKAIEEDIKKGHIKKMDPRELMVNLMSLLIFPFAARKIIEGLIFSGDTEAYNEFILKRKDHLKATFIQSIKV